MARRQARQEAGVQALLDDEPMGGMHGTTILNTDDDPDADGDEELEEGEISQNFDNAPA